MNTSRFAVLMLVLTQAVWSGTGTAVAAPGALARADDFVSKRWAEGIAWEPQPVRPQVAPKQVKAITPFVPAGGEDVRGKVYVDAERGAAFFIRPLEVVRVFSEGPVRFTRIPANSRADASTVRLEERAISARPGLFYLAENIGEGSVWVVTSAKKAEVRVERPTLIYGPYAAEALRTALLSCIDGGRDCPTLPQFPSVRTELAVGAELAQLLTQSSAEVEDAAQDYRKALVLRALNLVEPLSPTTFALQYAAMPGKHEPLDEQSNPYFQQVEPRGAQTLVLEGPGVLSLQVRGLAGEKAGATVTLRDGPGTSGRLLGRVSLPAAPSYGSDSEDTALPSSREPRRNSDGDVVAVGEELRVLLPPGTQRYTVEWSGGAVLLRPRWAERRPFLSEVMDGSADYLSLAARGLARLKDKQGPAAALLRHELQALVGKPGALATTEDAGNDVLRAMAGVIVLEQATTTATASKLDDKTVARINAVPSSSALGWRLRMRAAAASPSQALTLLDKPRAVPDSGGQLYDFAEALCWASPTGREVQVLSALELAWRQAPLSDTVRRRYRSAFHDTTRWSTLRGRAGEPLTAPQWLDIEQTEEGALPAPRALSLLQPAAPNTFYVAKGTTLRAWVLQGDEAQPVTLRVGAQRYTLNAISPLERVEVAMPEGTHEVAVEGNGRAFIALPATRSAAERAFVRAAYPVGSSKKDRIRFVRPANNSPLPLRISLRSSAQTKTPVLVVMRTDTGAAQRLWLDAAEVSARQLRLDDDRATKSSPVAHAVVTVPPLTHEVWFETDAGADIFATVSTRSTADDEAEPTAVALAPASEQELQRLLELSRLIRTATVPSPVLLLERAELLLRFEEPLLARADLTVLVQRDSEFTVEQARKLRRLVDHLQDSTIAAHAVPQNLSAPVLLSPGYPSGQPQTDRTAAIAARARAEGPDAALTQLNTPTTQAERWLKARLLVQAGKAGDALSTLVELHHETPSAYVARDAVDAFGETPPGSEAFEKFAPLMMPLSAHVAKTAPLQAPRRVVNLANRATRWEALSNVEQSAGAEVVKADRTESLRAAVRKAVIAPDFDPEHSHFIRSGDASVLQVTVERGNAMGVDFECGGQPVAARRGDCVVALRVDGKTVETRRVPVGTATLFTVAKLAAGRHQLELNVTEGGVGLARYFTRKPDGTVAALDSAKPASFQRALKGQPVAFTVLGPAVLRLGTALPEQPEQTEPPAIAVEVTLPSGATEKPELAQTADGVRYLVLKQQGPHRVTLSSEDQETLVRAELGHGEREVEALTETRLTLAELDAESEPLPMPAAPPRLALLPGESDPMLGDVQDIGTLSGELSFRQEAIPEDELPNRPLSTGLEARFSFRRNLADRKAFVRVSPLIRVPVGRAAVTGGALSFLARQLPLGTRVLVSGGALTQQFEQRWRSSWSAHAGIDRPFTLSPNLRLFPSVRFSALGFSQIEGAAEDGVDRSVYTRFGRDHARRLTPALALRWTPLQDQVGGISARAMTNADLATIDNWTSNARWTALLGGPMRLTRLSLGYELSQRFADLHRREGYLRHAVEVGLDRSLWTMGQGRLLMFAENRLELSSPFGPQNLFSLGVRWDWTGGRGLSDLMPGEEEFDALLESGRSAD